jgi:hypothetical protein
MGPIRRTLEAEVSHSEQSHPSPRRNSVLVFLAGFVPQYAMVNHLGAEFATAQLVNAPRSSRTWWALRTSWPTKELRHRSRHDCAVVQPRARTGESGT